MAIPIGGGAARGYSTSETQAASYSSASGDRIK
jgi:hypothetical protein